MKETLLNRDSNTLLVNTQDWDHIWKERDLRRAGLLGIPIERNHTSRPRVSRHDITQSHDTASDAYDTFMTESRRQSWCNTVSSDLSGEDGNKYYSMESLMHRRLVLDQSNSQRKDIHATEGAESHQDGQECSPALSRCMVIFEKKMVSKCYTSLTLLI
jgi:hypothetical protein